MGTEDGREDGSPSVLAICYGTTFEGFKVPSGPLLFAKGFKGPGEGFPPMSSPPDWERWERQFGAERKTAINHEWERVKWLAERERSYNLSSKGIAFGPLRLYSEARFCYMAGAFGATCWAAMAAAERFLRSRLKADEWTKLDKLTADAEAQGLTSSATGARLRELWVTVRNPVVHGKEPYIFGYLGTIKSKDWEGWESPPGKFALKDDEAAREALDAFLMLVHEAPPVNRP